MRLVATACATGLLAITSSYSHSQSVLEIAAGIKFCRTLTDDAQRLKCFDSLFTEKQSAPAEKPQTEFTWSIEDSRSPIDDSPQVTATLFAEGSSPPAVTGLTLRCKEKKTEVIFAKSFSYFGSTESIKVLVRINEGKPIETSWHPSSNGQGAFAPAAVQFIRALPDNGKLFIRATGFGGNSADGLFNLGKVSEVKDKIAAACQWQAAIAPTPHVITPAAQQQR